MFGYLVSMFFGIAIFCGGIMFERYEFSNAEEIDTEEPSKEIDTAYLKQWERLLNYDGNEKENEYED